MTPIAAFHTTLGVVALASGAAVLARRKGDRRHRLVGRVYAGTMVVLCIAAFGLHDSTPFFQGLGAFHIAAVISFVSVVAGFVTVWRRRDGWLGAHYSWMAWSYIGLVMATGGHVMRPVFLFLLRGVGLPVGLCWALAIGIVWGLPPLVGSWWIARRQPGWDLLGAPASVASE